MMMAVCRDGVKGKSAGCGPRRNRRDRIGWQRGIGKQEPASWTGAAVSQPRL